MDAPLIEGENDRVRALAARSTSARSVTCAPDAGARATAAAFDPHPIDCPALRDADPGRWRGRRLAEIAAAEPDALRAWTSDPSFAGHGGESHADVAARVRPWLHSVAEDEGCHLAVARGLVIRLLLVDILEAPLAALWRLDVRPLSVTTLSNDGRRWAIREMGVVHRATTARSDVAGEQKHRA